MGTFFFHQRFPPVSIYSSLFSCGTHVSSWHMYLTGWYLILILLSYFLLKMVSVMNELHCYRKVVTYFFSQKSSNDHDMIQLQNQQFTNSTLDEHKLSTELLIFSKVVFKNFANFTGKHQCREKCEPKSWIYPCSLHLHYKRDSCTQLFFSEFGRIFKNTFF